VVMKSNNLFNLMMGVMLVVLSSDAVSISEQVHLVRSVISPDQAGIDLGDNNNNDDYYRQPFDFWYSGQPLA